MVPSVWIQSLEQLYSSLTPLNIQLLSLDWVPLIAALGPNDRSWSCLLKLKGLVFTLVVKLCLLYSYKVLRKLCLLYSYKVLRNLGFQPLSELMRDCWMLYFHNLINTCLLPCGITGESLLLLILSNWDRTLSLVPTVMISSLLNHMLLELSNIVFCNQCQSPYGVR